MSESLTAPIIIVGGGHAAAQLCASLAQAGLGPLTHVVCEEQHLPYHRPPLSKGFLKNSDEQPMPHKAADWYAEAGIQLHLGDPAIKIDRAQRTVTLRSGVTLPWGKLVLATGTRARSITLPQQAPADVSSPQPATGSAAPTDDQLNLSTLTNVATLRHADDAERLRQLLGQAERIVVLGGGFIGLEIAATAKAQGKQVTVLEATPRLIGRAATESLSEYVLAAHRQNGMDIRVNTAVDDFDIQDKRVCAVQAGGESIALDLLVLGIGAHPETSLAQAAGLACDDGIIVDGHMRTSDLDILAIGDCTRFPDLRAGRALRLESVQNANDQAKTACATLAGTPQAHDALAWFWSDQGTLRLQMAGLPPVAGSGELLTVRRQGAKPESFSLLHYVDGKLSCVESVNAPMDHIASRKLLESGANPAPEAVADGTVPLKSFVPTATPAA